jgi:iron complex outermembrane recepter protein
MRLKSLALATSSFAILAIAAPAFAQDAAAAQQAPADPVAAEADEAIEGQGQDIVVTGLRRSLESAQNIRRNSDQIVDAIVAEDIGKLPDITASATLARVTGVQVNRGAAEAADVQIRGLPNISTTYNGREIFTAENRNVAIQDFPAGVVQALEVFKSGTANLIESGIGGQVNVRSRRPFDFDGFELSGSLNGVHFEQSGKVDWNGNLLVSDRWDTGIGEIGVLVNAAMTNIDFLDSTRENDRYVSPEPGQTPGPGDFVRPNGQGIFYGSGNRWRPSVNGAIQWRPSSSLEIYVDGLFQGYRGEDRNHWMFVPTFGPGPQYTNVVLRRDPANSAQSMTVTNGGTPDGYDEFRKARTDTYQIAGGAVWSSDSLRISGDVAYTDSTYTERQANIDYAFASSPVRNISFDSDEGPGGATFDFLNFNAADPSNYYLRGLFDRVYEAKGDDIQARVDVQYQTGLGFLDRVDIGFRYDDRSASRRDGDRYAGLRQLNILYPDLPVDIGQIRGFRFDRYQPETAFPVATFDSVFANLSELQRIAGFPAGDPAFNQLSAFTASERSYAGYAQLRYAFDIGLPVDGLVGIRGVQTETSLNGTSISNTGVISPVSSTSKYTDWLPNASLRATIADGLQFRLAYTKTRTRPSFVDLNPSTTFGTIPGACTPVAGDTSTGVDSPGCNVTNRGGNPNLQPIKSDNYDASLEWYFARTGSLIGTLFRRDVNGFVFRSAVDPNNPGIVDIIEDRPYNAGSGKIQGAELAFTGFLDFAWLPEWARGFGFQANYTYIDASTELQPDFREERPGQQPFPGVSKHAFNLVGMYERDQLSARLAYNWRSDFATEYNNFQSNIVSPTVQEAYGTLDFSASVTPVENLTFAFDALNILGTPIRTSRAYNLAGDSYPWGVRYVERVYSAGVRFRF